MIGWPMKNGNEHREDEVRKTGPPANETVISFSEYHEPVSCVSIFDDIRLAYSIICIIDKRDVIVFLLFWNGTIISEMNDYWLIFLVLIGGDVIEIIIRYRDWAIPESGPSYCGSCNIIEIAACNRIYSLLKVVWQCYWSFTRIEVTFILNSLSSKDGDTWVREFIDIP